MGLLSRVWFRVANDAVHDLSAGVWPGAVIALWLVRTEAKTVLPSDAFAATQLLWSRVFLVMLGAVVVLVVTGAVRVYYRGLDMTPELLRARTRAAAMKHAVFVTVFVLATVAAFVIVQP